MRCTMNHSKRGQFLLLLPLLSLVALGVFLVFFVGSDTKDAIQEKGVSTAEFMEIYQEVQRRQTQITSVGYQSVTQNLAEYMSRIWGEGCGSVHGTRLLLGNEQACPYTVDQYLAYLSENFSQEYGLYSATQRRSDYWGSNSTSGSALKQLEVMPLYSVEADSQEFLFSYDGEHQKVHAAAAEEVLYINGARTVSYSIHPHFDVPLGLSLAENFTSLFARANLVLNSCANSLVLQDCLEDTLPAGWHYGSCEVLGYEEEARVVPFCVNSGMKVFSSEGVEELQYSFAMDFSPTESFIVQGVEVEKDETGAYTVYFDSQDTATGYSVYVTDYALPSFQGSVSQFALQRFNSDVFVELAIDSSEVEENCSGSGQLNLQAYSCLGGVQYLVDLDELLDDETYYFAVTSLVSESESQINGFAMG